MVHKETWIQPFSRHKVNITWQWNRFVGLRPLSFVVCIYIYIYILKKLASWPNTCKHGYFYHLKIKKKAIRIITFSSHEHILRRSSPSSVFFRFAHSINSMHFDLFFHISTAFYLKTVSLSSLRQLICDYHLLFNLPSSQPTQNLAWVSIYY